MLIHRRDFWWIESLRLFIYHWVTPRRPYDRLPVSSRNLFEIYKKSFIHHSIKNSSQERIFIQRDLSYHIDKTITRTFLLKIFPSSSSTTELGWILFSYRAAHDWYIWRCCGYPCAVSSSSGGVCALFFFPSVSSFLIYLFCYAVVMGGIPRWPTGPCLDIDEFASPPVPSETHRRLEEASKRSITQDEREKEYTRIM